jgi:branched-chain amino acid transport system substrate-binding protein
MRRISVILSVVLAVALSAPVTAPAQSKEPVKIGLSAAVSGGSAASGEAIKRGLQIAIDEINAKGGVLGGRKLELVIRDDEGNPQKGVTIARELVEREKVAAVFGGLHTTVALAQVPVWQELKTPYMGAWAAGTNVTRNGQTPNYVFRVSANDDYVDRFLSRYAIDVLKKGKPGLLLENTPWGQSNEAGLTKWFGEKGIKAVGVERFNWNDPDMSPQLLRLKSAGADHIVLVANAPEGAQVLRSKAKLGWDTAMISCRPTPSSASRTSAASTCSRCCARSTASRNPATSSRRSARPTPTTASISSPSPSTRPAPPTAPRSATRSRTSRASTRDSSRPTRGRSRPSSTTR